MVENDGYILIDDYEKPTNKTEESKVKGGTHGVHSTGFKDLLLCEALNKSLASNGFEHPSEVQQQCLQHSLVGVDILCQAKAGMGKTAVFVLTILNRLKKEDKECSALIITHARELAIQISDEFKRFSGNLEDINTVAIYGGEKIDTQIEKLNEKKPKIIVGTPGRLLSLVKKGILKTSNVSIFVLDECDKMLNELDMRADIQAIFKTTPHKKQVMMFSATMPNEVREIGRKFMNKPFEVIIDDPNKLVLHGLQQYYVNLQEKEKNRKLNDLLDNLQFNQVIIFVSNVVRCSELNKLLNEFSFPSIAIHGKLEQEERIQRYKDFKEFKKRIMVATDVFGRGIDIERVNIVINYDMPESADTYLHRVGRAGRFGTKGLTISFISGEEDKKVLEEIQNRFAVKMKEYPFESHVESNTYMN